MKAWHVHDGYPEEGSLLVFAETRNKARWAGVWGHPLNAGDMEYKDMIATRVPKYDNLFNDERVCCDNSDLPEGTPDLFWCDEEEA